MRDYLLGLTGLEERLYTFLYFLRRCAQQDIGVMIDLGFDVPLSKFRSQIRLKN